MSINRITRERLYRDEELFNKLLPYGKFHEEFELFVHSDASLWSLWEINPRWITSTSDSLAFQTTASIQEMTDSLDHRVSVQFNWVTTFDVEELLNRCEKEYPADGAAGWMAKRWTNHLRKSAHHGPYNRRPRCLRLILGFRFDPPWRAVGLMEQLKRSFQILIQGKIGVTVDQRKREFEDYANQFRGVVDGNISKLRDLGYQPRRLDGQGIIDLLYPVLNRRSIKSGKFRRGRNTRIAAPKFDKADFLVNQLSDTPVQHDENGVIRKDGRYFRSVSMVKPPKQCFPLMITPLQNSPYENVISVTISKDPREKQIRTLDQLDQALGFRERNPFGRSNQKIQHQIRSIRTAREELYNNSCELVRIGLHQTFFCQTREEAVRASAEAVATFPQLNGARGMVHEISDLAVMVNALPGCYDPATDGAGWTSKMRSSRATRMLPLWGNWKGSKGSLFVLPSLWNRELVGFDLYDSNTAPNVLISGVSGAGKSYLLCYFLITLSRGHFATLADGRTVGREPITFVFDKGMAGQPCGFDKLAKLFGGRIYEATPSKAPAMNFLSRLGRTAADSKIEDYRDLVDIASDIICDMASEGNKTVDRLDRNVVVESLVEAHRIYRTSAMKREFILSDCVAVLRAPRRIGEAEDAAKRRQRVAMLIGDYYGNGTYARFFDRPGALELKERFIVFDLKGLSRNPDLQRVFLKVAMLWADEVMNTPSELDTRKMLVFDEAHDLIGKTSANTIETAFRLYRKRKGIVIAASQSGEDFYVGSGGQAIVQNSSHKIFLRQDPSKFHYTAKAFNLNDQQASTIMRLRTIKGVESQFFLLSDIGEGALVLPLEPAFYWASTNNGDDNQLFNQILEECRGDVGLALRTAVELAPYGATYFRGQIRTEETSSVSGA
jgi:hypothetical protein